MSIDRVVTCVSIFAEIWVEINFGEAFLKLIYSEKATNIYVTMLILHYITLAEFGTKLRK
jgi:hypothetical protein